MAALYVGEEKAGCEFANEENTTAQGKTAIMADAVSTRESTHAKPALSQFNLSPQTNFSDNPLSEDTRHLSKPSLSYIALIAKVILSSPSQKLNLASIYRAMEERFPYLRSRGQGWRNSVRHNLSVNHCFVKVGRCEDGRGHYWGVHPAHLRDFQQGNFKQSRKAKGRRERGRYDSMAGCLACMETSCLLGLVCESRARSLSWVEPRRPLQEPGSHLTSSLDWAEARHQPWTFSLGWAESPSRVTHYYFPERPPDSHDRATVGRWHHGRPLTPRLGCWATLSRMAESYDSMCMTPLLQPFSPPGSWCVTPVFEELTGPLPYKDKRFISSLSSLETA